jgi:hypothetical protein
VGGPSPFLRNGKDEMLIRLTSAPRRSRSSTFLVVLFAVVMFGGTSALASSWERFHGDGANTGFVDVPTARAGRGSLSVPGLGKFAPGAGPVIAKDGTVYLGTQEGRVIALRADGRVLWRREITPGQSIVASPAIGADGSVYVVGVKSVVIRDHRNGKTITRRVFEATLHRFTSSGGRLGPMRFPTHGGEGPATSAPPNIVNVKGAETILVPTFYRVPPNVDLRLIGFSPSGALTVDQRVSLIRPGAAVGGGDVTLADALFCVLTPLGGPLACLTCGGFCSFEAPKAGSSLPPPPTPGVAVFSFPGGSAPFIVVNDRATALVGLTIIAGKSPAEVFRVDAGRRLVSPPTVLPTGTSLVGTADGAIVFGGPSGTSVPTITGLGPVHAAPTRLADGRVAVVQTNGRVAVLRDQALEKNVKLTGETLVPAAASRTHLFVSTTDAFYTLDPVTLDVISKVDWVGGGISPPAIGPQGHVYGIASHILFVFPPPNN